MELTPQIGYAPWMQFPVSLAAPSFIICSQGYSITSLCMNKQKGRVNKTALWRWCASASSHWHPDWHKRHVFRRMGRVSSGCRLYKARHGRPCGQTGGKKSDRRVECETVWPGWSVLTEPGSCGGYWCQAFDRYTELVRCNQNLWGCCRHIDKAYWLMFWPDWLILYLCLYCIGWCRGLRRSRILCWREELRLSLKACDSGGLDCSYCYPLAGAKKILFIDVLSAKGLFLWIIVTGTEVVIMC